MSSISKQNGKPGFFRSGDPVSLKETVYSAVSGRPHLVYWVVMGLFSVLIITVEILDHYSMHVAHGSNQLLFEDQELIREIVMYGIMLPVFGGILLTWLTRIGVERDVAIEELDQQRAFTEEIHEISDWNELSAQIVSYPGTILPASRSFLTVFDLEDQRSELVAQWASSGDNLPSLAYEPAHLKCLDCLPVDGSMTCPVQDCNDSEGLLVEEHVTRYCLPITSGSELLAVLNFDLTNSEQLTEQHRRMLADAEPQIALAIENAQLHRSKSSLAEVAGAERRRIARDLHDTLAQNITYLRLKLDQLGSEGSLQEISSIKYEIDRMRLVADEAYLQVRQTLVDLSTEKQVDLTTAITEVFNSSQNRAGYQVHIESNGRPLPLPPKKQSQVIFICREALNNIEQHAQARSVWIDLVWDKDDLTIIIRDDGRGFDPEKSQNEQSYGMIFMDERAATIGGQLTVKSIPNQGTTITLVVPLPEDDRTRVVSKSKSGLEL